MTSPQQRCPRTAITWRQRRALASNEKEISHGYRWKTIRRGGGGGEPKTAPQKTGGVREGEDQNRTREVGNRDEVEGVVANTLKLYRDGAVGFIDWLGLGFVATHFDVVLVRPGNKTEK